MGKKWTYSFEVTSESQHWWPKTHLNYLANQEGTRCSAIGVLCQPKDPSNSLFSQLCLALTLSQPHHPSAFIPHLGDKVIGLVQGSTV